MLTNVATARINRTESGNRSVAIGVAANCCPAGMKPAETPFSLTKELSANNFPISFWLWNRGVVEFREYCIELNLHRFFEILRYLSTRGKHLFDDANEYFESLCGRRFGHIVLCGCNRI